MSRLIFDEANYTVQSVEREGITVTCRAFEQIPYVSGPAEETIQRLSIFVPECYYAGGTIGRYHLKNAPIFMPNTVGGYLPGTQERPGTNFRGETNASFYALLHGYVVVSPGVRGRGMKDAAGNYIGMAPAAICDLKAAVRYLRHNAGRVPGDTEKIISNGTSAGGALSALLGTTGNHPDYDPYLRDMGAAQERDDIFAASCYCPITNLEHADMAYEWEFGELRHYHNVRYAPPAPGETAQKGIADDGVLTEAQEKMSEELKAQFPAYVNSLGLKDECGNMLTLTADGSGTFRDFIASYVAASAQEEADRGVDLSAHSWLTMKDGRVQSVDFPGYAAFRTRMKQTPAFDNVAMGTPENELFGNAQTMYRHFTAYSMEHSLCGGVMADPLQIRQMNPMCYMEDERAVKAPHVRIRHGAVDRDTSLAISAMLCAKLKNCGVAAELAYPWGKVHAGDYDLNELFSWIDGIVAADSQSNK